MDALQILGLGCEGDANGHDSDLDGDEEVLCCNNTGTDEDRAFDTIIGAIESVMISDAFRGLLDKAIADCPPFDALDDHARFQVHKGFLAAIEALVDDQVAAAVPDMPLEKIAAMVKARESEVSDDVIDLVNGACVSYQQFAALWQDRDRKQGIAAA